MWEEIVMNFGEALELLKDWKSVQRKNWNGKWLYLTLQTPTEKSKMTRPYIYITVPKWNWWYNEKDFELIPWLASQSDLLSNDWIIY